MAEGSPAKGGKRNRKWGRNRLFCSRYSQENRREQNRIRRLLSYCRSHPADIQAHDALKRWAKAWPFFGREAQHYLDKQWTKDAKTPTGGQSDVDR